MTALWLQRDLREEIERILSGMRFKNLKGTYVCVGAYAQKLPKRQKNFKPEDEDKYKTDEDEEPYPFCIVKIDSGSFGRGVQQVKTGLVFGIYDDDVEHQGHQDILNIIQKIAERFTKNPLLADKYRLNASAGIGWVLNDEDRYPYYFGTMEMVWDTFAMEREDEYV